VATVYDFYATVLHLLGFDHENEIDAAMMEAREIEILKGLGVPAPYDDTI